MFEDLTRETQLAIEANWQNPNTHVVTATIPFKRDHTLLDTQFLVAVRQRGAAKGHRQTHHGGHISPTDQSVMAAAQRELREETGLSICQDDLHLVGVAGPELYRSTMTINGDNITVTITNIQAEPTAPFVIFLFVADANNAEVTTDTDGELSNQEWVTLKEIIAQYGQSTTFNYFSFMAEAVRYLIGREEPRLFLPSSPSIYHLNM